MNRVALVIGNGNYKFTTKLNNPCNDANDMAERLEQLDFKVYKYIDVDQEKLINIITQFKKELINYSTGLFYYAGHGIEIKGVNYLVPIDCKIDSEELTAFSCYKLDDLLDAMSFYNNKTNIIILDSCRSNPFTRLLRGSMVSGFKPLAKAPQGTIISYATSPDSFASDGSDRNGLFTGALIKHIDKENIKIEDLFKIVRSEVIKLSAGSQTPWEHSSLTGDFYFSVKESKVLCDVSDEVICNFIEERWDYYKSKESFTIHDEECLAYIDAYNKFKIPIIKLLRSYLRVKNKENNVIISDSEIDEININYLISWGFEYKNYRWYYKDKYVEMGDLLPVSEKFQKLDPIENRQINVEIEIEAEIKNNLTYFLAKTNLPTNTPFLWTISSKDRKYVAQCNSEVKDGIVKSLGFSEKGELIEDGMYTISLISPINSVQPMGIKELFGDRNRNLVGPFVKFNTLGGNIIEYKKIILKKGKDIFSITR